MGAQDAVAWKLLPEIVGGSLFNVPDKDQSEEAQLQEAINQIVNRDYGNPTEFQELKREALVFSLETRKFVKWAEI